MDAQITVGQLINIVLIVAGGGVLVALFKTLMNINNIVSSISKIVQQNEHNINHILNSIPKILENAEQITESVNDELIHVSSTIKALEETAEYTASAAQVVTEDVVLPAKEILAVFSLLKDIFSKDKKRGWFKR